MLGGRQLQRLADPLQARHPGAAASLRQGFEEKLTVQELGITGALYRTLRTTNPIENFNGWVARFSRNVKRWGDGQMVLRWWPARSATRQAARTNCVAARRCVSCSKPSKHVAPMPTPAPSEKPRNIA